MNHNLHNQTGHKDKINTKKQHSHLQLIKWDSLLLCGSVKVSRISHTATHTELVNLPFFRRMRLSPVDLTRGEESKC